MPGLADKYRPTTWDGVVGQDRCVARLRALAARGGLAGRAYFLTGQSGTGKSTIARLIAAEVADPFLIEELDAAALTVAQLQALEAEMQLTGWGEKSGRAYLVNEAHALRKPVIRTIEGRELSIFNQCLVAHQRPGASIVGGFAQWKRAGRSVVKGARGLAIWVPTGRRANGAAEGQSEPTAGDVFSLVDGADGAEQNPARRGFVMGTVFDVSQTEVSKGRDEAGEPWDYAAARAAVAFAEHHPEGRMILAAHRDDPADDTTRKALCDWLMDRGLIDREASADALMLAGLVGA